MIQNQTPGYENIGSFETSVKDYARPAYTKKVTLNTFVEKRTGNVFVGSKKPEITLEAFIKASGKEPRPIIYDITERI